MSWDDSGSAFLHGTGPTIAVLDPDGTPNNILDEPIGGTCVVRWSFSGGGKIFLDPTVFTVTVYAGAIGPGPDKEVGSVNVAGTAHTVSGTNWDFAASIPISPGTLPAESGAAVSGVYRLTTVISNSVGGTRDVLAGFVDGPVIEMRNP